MFPNKIRQQTAESPYYKLDPYDLPTLLKNARKKLRDELREADRSGALNEEYGPEEIDLTVLDDDEVDVNIREMNSCAGVVWMATYRVMDSMRQIFTRFAHPTQNDLDCERGDTTVQSLSPFSFDLGPHTRLFQNSAMADAPQIGNMLTYKVVLDSGVALDVLEVDIPDRSGIKPLLELHRDVQAEILSEKCASLLWIFQERTQIILVTESSSPYTWTPQQWFRKILSDMALADSIMIGHPYYWHPVVKRRLTKALKHFKKLYKTITDQEKVIKMRDELGLDGSASSSSSLSPSPRVHPDDGKLRKSDVAKYKSKDGKDCVKAMEYFPHSRTRVEVSNFSSQRVADKQMNDILGELNQNWGQFRNDVTRRKQFTPLQKVVEMEEKERIEFERANEKKQKEMGKVLYEIVKNDSSRITYKDLYKKSVLGSDPSLIEVIQKKAGPNSRVSLRNTAEVTDFSTKFQNCSEDTFEVIKSADMNVKTNYAIGAQTSSSEKRWKDSVYSQSDNVFPGLSKILKSKSHKPTRRQQQQQPTQGPSRSEGYLPRDDEPRSNNRSRSHSPYYVEAETFHDRPGPLASGRNEKPPKNPSRRQHEGKARSQEMFDAPQKEPWENDENILKLGLSKTRHRIDHPFASGSATEVGPPMPTFNEPYAMQGHVFGYGIPQAEYHEIPPADADSLSTLTPHGLSSREGLIGVVDQLGLETHMIPQTHHHGHTTVQQHRCGSGARNASNLGAYHAATHNKSLESLDLGQPIGNPSRARGKRGSGKASGARCSQCHLDDHPAHSS